MFYEHLALTKAEALAFLNKDYEAGVKLYDKVEKKLCEMSDMITNAIVQQFASISITTDLKKQIGFVKFLLRIFHQALYI